MKDISLITVLVIFLFQKFFLRSCNIDSYNISYIFDFDTFSALIVLIHTLHYCLIWFWNIYIYIFETVLQIFHLWLCCKRYIIFNFLVFSLSYHFLSLRNSVTKLCQYFMIDYYWLKLIHLTQKYQDTI